MLLFQIKEYFNVKEYEGLNPSTDEIYCLVECANINCEDNYFLGLYIKVFLTLNL